MNQYPLWKYLLLGVMLIIGVVYTLPNLYGEDNAVQISLKDSAVISGDVETQVKTILTQQNLKFSSVSKTDNQILVRFPDTDTQLHANDVIAATLGANYVVAPNLAPRTPQWLQAIGADPIKLGLDLRGGVHFLLAVDVDESQKAREIGDVHNITADLREGKIHYNTIRRLPQGGIEIAFKDAATLEQAFKFLPARLNDYVVTEDIANGKFLLVAQMSKPAEIKLRDYAIEQTMTILNNRINELGVSEAVVQQQ
ncbi:MAG: protein translocase subunit SecD, partial [Pseudomonadota bacterium]|nr:protein translocase subunit SecD [Pseudomonadota bacterium]